MGISIALTNPFCYDLRMQEIKLAHKLKARHILMIALGSAIGTGLFFGAGESIQMAGPSILVAYLIGGIMMYIIVRALGEMAVDEPNAGSFSYYAYKYIGDYAGFLTGWNYWFNYIIVCMLELTATTLFLDYWIPNSSHWLLTLIILVFFSGINLINVKFFGEFEFWFAGIKVVTIIAMILFGAYIIFTTDNSVSHVSNLWNHGGFFANGLQGFCFAFVIVVFSFGGTELVGIAAGEAENPKKNIPMAITGIIARILIFYIATLAIIMCLYPWNQIDAHISPFVDVFKQIGFAKAASLMNLVAISAALSSFNSGIYGTARMAYNLSLQGNAPKPLARLSRNHIPTNAIIFSSLFILITVLLNYLYPKQVFNILLSLATIAAIINWLMILITQVAFRRKKQATDIVYKMPFFPFSSIIAISFFVIIALVMTQMSEMKSAIFIAPIWLTVLSLAYLAKKHKKIFSKTN